MVNKPKDKSDCKVKKSCSPEMMKQRSGLIYAADDVPKPLPTPYERIHKTTRWLP